MRNFQLSTSKLSLLACLLLAITVRFSYHTNDARNGYNATTWDALGYYMYLPGAFIYKDVKTLKWFPGIDKKYNVSGGSLYQANQLESGDFAFKYLGGVAIMQSPFFALGHLVACFTEAPEDGFSWPYQYAIIWGAVFWFFIGLVYLRKVLLVYFDEKITALTLFFVVFATNLIQYISVDGAMSHAYIFPLYAIVLWLTIRWHEQPKKSTAFLIGLVIGLATISRPTELIMVFIPILWGLDGGKKLTSKWLLVKMNKTHLFWAVLGGIIGIFPQLAYWKYATGSWVYDVGSKWYFLNPWWRVLIGFEKGWFIYTPITILFVVGLFLMKGKPFRKAILTFSLLNIWIIISWSDWRYGASYSVRALTQSYPVFALAFATFLSRYYTNKSRILIGPIGLYLVLVNLFQVYQYNKTILHFDDMNWRYYGAIYLDSHPSPADYSLLDTASVKPANIHPLKTETFYAASETMNQSNKTIFASKLEKDSKFISYKTNVFALHGLETTNWKVQFFSKNKLVLERNLRGAVPNWKNENWMRYEAYFELEPNCDSCSITLNTFGELKWKALKTVVQQCK